MPPTPERFLRIPTAARILDVDRGTVYDFIDRGLIVAVHLDGLKRRPLRVVGSSLDAYMARQRRAVPLRFRVVGG